jgi:hypothetical protein
LWYNFAAQSSSAAVAVNKAVVSINYQPSRVFSLERLPRTEHTNTTDGESSDRTGTLKLCTSLLKRGRVYIEMASKGAEPIRHASTSNQ